MKAALLVLALGALGSVGCANTAAEAEAAKARAEAEKAKAEAEVARAKAEAARAEAEAARAMAEAEAARAKARAEAEAEKARIAAAEAKAREEAARPAREAELRKTIGADALARVQRNGQTIATGAFPAAIGAVPYRFATLEGVASEGDGYRATVNLYYTNILKSDFYMEIIITYDSVGGFRGSRIGYCNDKFATPDRGKLFDRFLN